MKNIKIILASIIAVFVLGGFAFAKLPDRTQKLVTFHEALVVERQEMWKNLNEEQKFYQDKVDEIIAEKEKVSKEADVFRETISVLKGEDLAETDVFPQPLN